MARKKAEKPEMPTTAEPKVKPVRLDLTPEEHKMLRLEAAEEETSMNMLARQILVQALVARRAKR